MVRTTRHEIWKAIVEEKFDVIVDKQNKEWVDKKDFMYLYFEYRALILTNVLLLVAIGVLAIMYMFSGVK